MDKEKAMKKERRVHFVGSNLEEEEARARRGQKQRKKRRIEKEQREVEEYSKDLRQIYNAYKILKSNDKLEQILAVYERAEQDESQHSFRSCLASFLRSIGVPNQEDDDDDIRAQMVWFQRDSRSFDELYELKSVPTNLYRLSCSEVFQSSSSAFVGAASFRPQRTLITPPPEATTIIPGFATREPESHCTFIVVNSQVRHTCNCGNHGSSSELLAQDTMDAIYANTTASLAKQEDDLGYSKLTTDNPRKTTLPAYPPERQKPTKGMEISFW